MINLNIKILFKKHPYECILNDLNNNQPVEVKKNELAWIVAALMFSLTLAALDQTIVTTALATIVSDLGKAGKLSWIVSSYLVASVSSMLLFGKLGDTYGRSRMIKIAIYIFLLGSALCGVSSNLGTLIVARIIQGLGAGGLFPLILAIIADLIPLKNRAKYQGAFGAVFGLSSLLGPLIGGSLTDLFSWRAIFYVNLPIGAVSLFLLYKHLPDLKRSNVKIKLDYIGVVLSTLCVVSILLLSLLGGKEYAWNSATIICLICISMLSLVLFLLQEKYHVDPILPLSLFKYKVYSLMVSISFISGALLISLLIYLTLYLQVVKGVSPTRSGIALLPLTIGILITSTLVVRKISQDGKIKNNVMIGFILISTASFLMSKFTPVSSAFVVSIVLIIAGLGLGLLLQLPNLVLTTYLPDRYLGVASASITFFRSMGSAIGATFFGLVLNHELSRNLSEIMSKIFKEKIDMPTEIDSFKALDKMPPGIKKLVLEGFSNAVNQIFFYSSIIALLGVILALTLPKINLSEGKE